ncbi:MAG TPA: response regulator [Proteobacteria bacterium]|nr:response regulator [Pseudomonadota bacterium]
MEDASSPQGKRRVFPGPSGLSQGWLSTTDREKDIKEKNTPTYPGIHNRNSMAVSTCGPRFKKPWRFLRTLYRGDLMPHETADKDIDNRQNLPGPGKTPGAGGENSRSEQLHRNPLRLLIVDDSRLIRTAVRSTFEQDSRIRVVGEAGNGREALEMIPQIKPDVVTLDINMPKMDGLLTLKHIMIKHPTPTVMLSSLTREGATKTFDALRFGAIDFIEKPSRFGDEALATQRRQLREKIMLVANVRIENVRLLRSTATSPAADPAKTDIEHYVVFGASEGGYGALLKIIPRLKPQWPATYLAVVHADPSHIDAFADYLHKHSAINVQRAVNGITLQNGTCYLAAGSEYITTSQEQQGLSLRVHPSPFPDRRGAINMLMLSLSEIMPQRTIGIILSGREQDGAEGVAEIARMKGKVIIQSPHTCLFREMPQAAILKCSSGKVLPDAYIADAIKTYCQTL